MVGLLWLRVDRMLSSPCMPARWLWLIRAGGWWYNAYERKRFPIYPLKHQNHWQEPRTSLPKKSCYLDPGREAKLQLKHGI